MTNHPLVFDWSKSEASRKDKIFSVIIVGLLFALFMGLIELSLPSLRGDSEAQGTLIRLVDEEMAKSWALEAEENGPFPGRLESDGGFKEMIFAEHEGSAWWSDYKVRLRPMREESGVVRVDITPKGKREFPMIPISDGDTQGDDSTAASMPSEPILVPYDAAALEWLPEELPSFDLPAAAERETDSLRFLVSLREDGSLAELIPLAGAADPTQKALESWLRGIRFKKGFGERWFGLQVDFVNRRNDESESE